MWWVGCKFIFMPNPIIVKCKGCVGVVTTGVTADTWGREVKKGKMSCCEGGIRGKGKVCGISSS